MIGMTSGQEAFISNLVYNYSVAIRTFNMIKRHSNTNGRQNTGWRRHVYYVGR